MNKYLTFIFMAFSSLAHAKVSDVEIVAATIFSEAGGEGVVGMHAVANVIQTRTIERKLSARKVCLQKLQFSCWRELRPLESLRKAPLKSRKVAFKLACSIVEGRRLRDITGSANHYCRVDCFPVWAQKDKLTATINNHRFFRI